MDRKREVESLLDMIFITCLIFDYSNNLTDINAYKLFNINFKV